MRIKRTIMSCLLKGLQVWVVVCVCCSAACQAGSTSSGHGHAHGGHEHGGHGHGDERPAHVLTMVQEHAELFVEFPALVAGSSSQFAAHVTTLDGYTPVEEGKLRVVLTSKDLPGESWEVDRPARRGIFTPTIVPKYVGKRRLLVLVETGAYEERFDLGEFQVVEKGEDAQRGDEPGGSISFLKEQQWQVDFNIQAVMRAQVRPSRAMHAEVHLPPDGKVRVTTPFAGRISGDVDGIPNIGQKVKGGDVLAYVTPSLDSGSISQLHAELRKAQSELARATREKARIEPLVESGAISRKRLIEVENDIDVRTIEVSSARQRLSQHQAMTSRGGGDKSSRIAIRSPIDGTLVERTPIAGGYVSSGDSLFVVMDTSTLWLDVKVPEAELPGMEEPEGLWFKLPGEDGRVVEVSAQDALISAGQEIDSVTRLLSMVFSLEGVELPGSLRVGSLLDVHLMHGKPHDALVVPVTAVLEEKGLDVVFVMQGGESFERRVVRLGQRERGMVEVTQGLKEGEYIVSDGAYYVKLAGTSTGSVGHGHAH